MDKICRTCKKAKPANIKIFGRDKNQKDGIATQCKICRRKATNELRKREVPVRSASQGDDIQKLSMPCKKCNYPTRAVYINMKDYDKMKDKFYCAQCQTLAQSDEQLFDAVSVSVGGIGEIRPSELPLISS